MSHIRIVGGESVLNKPLPMPLGRGVNWSHDETQILLDLWAEEQQRPRQPDHEDSYLNNRNLYAVAMKRLGEMGFERNTTQIRFKLKQLKRRYKVLMSDKRAGGRRPGLQWEFFHQIDRILRRSTTKTSTSMASTGAPGSSAPRGTATTDTSAEAPGASLSRPACIGKRTSGSARPTAPSSAAPSTSRAATSDPTTSTAHQPPVAPPQQQQQRQMPAPTLPEVPESDYDENEDGDEEDGEVGDLDELTEEHEVQDLFAQSQTQGQKMDYSADVSENNGSTTTEPAYASNDPTAATNSSKSSKRAASSYHPQQHNTKKPRGRPKSSAPPPREDLTVAQAITDAVMRFIDHQSYHLSEQTKLLQRYLKFERARMRWEMDMETRRMKWEEEREMREEERRQRQEELQAKRVSDNREFMLQMAVVLGNGAATGTSQGGDSTGN